MRVTQESDHERGSQDKAAALAEGMEAAGALIENLEQEVADLRSDLDQAAVALKAAQEVSSRAGALEEKERARVEAERGRRPQGGDLRPQTAALGRAAPHQQRAHKRARRGAQLEEQRRTDVDAASSEARLDTIKEEFRREREALEARYRRRSKP